MSSRLNIASVEWDVGCVEHMEFGRYSLERVSSMMRILGRLEHTMEEEERRRSPSQQYVSGLIHQAAQAPSPECKPGNYSFIFLFSSQLLTCSPICSQ